MNVADNIVKILEEEGIDTVFGIPGEQIMPLYKALSNSSINHVLTRHEQGAAHAADGYTRADQQMKDRQSEYADTKSRPANPA